ncbi:hypothetical protein SALWKB12_0547 [Snodgrassella communis]|nr:hypothetical protein SALWKB12_2121 [Snodgrassella communis]KDN11802.1 hypothetical protein SALWKB12_1724 [Snodgrassella communis]KDN11975.1 hypothetical protein SALWKB12_1897 [Snodgrassella communis]KDN13692.1 hypothetical protein SALWKB12_0547 [Snodgrassella communis]
MGIVTSISYGLTGLVAIYAGVIGGHGVDAVVFAFAYALDGGMGILYGANNRYVNGYGKTTLFKGMDVVAFVLILGGADVDLFGDDVDVASGAGYAAAGLAVVVAGDDVGVAAEAADAAAAVSQGLAGGVVAFFLAADAKADAAATHEAGFGFFVVLVVGVVVFGCADVDVITSVQEGAVVGDDVAAADVDVFIAADVDFGTGDVAGYGFVVVGLIFV